MADALVVGGAGYVGRAIAEALRGEGVSVTTTSRVAGRADLVVCSGADLDRLLAERTFDQVVHLPRLNGDGVDPFLDRVDGARWVVFSSAQLASKFPAPGAEVARAREEVARSRGAAVLRPTMVYGRGGDVNITRVIRFLQRFRVPVIVGDGNQLVQPVHVDDVAALVVAHGRRPAGGRFDVGGDAAISWRSLIEHLRSALGLRLPAVRVRSAWLRAIPGGLPGLRPDQLLRLEEDKVVDITGAAEVFGWRPKPLRARLDQAVQEAQVSGT